MDLGTRLHNTTRDPHPVVLPALALVLAIAAWLSWRVLDLEWSEINWPLLVVAAGLVPASVAATAAEYRFIARSNGVRVGWRESIVITVMGTVANLLPIPGAAAVRVNDLVARKVQVSGAARATIAVGLLWLGWALTVSGIGLSLSGALALGSVMFVVGAAIVVASWFIAPEARRDWGQRHWFLLGSVIELSALGFGALRLWLTLEAIGTSANLLQAIGLVSAGAIASSVGIVPGGLGVRELIAGLLAPLIGLTAASAILALTVVRVSGLVVQAPLTAFIGHRGDISDGA